MKLSSQLLNNVGKQTYSKFESFEHGYRGLYSATQFVVRLRPDVRKLIEAMPTGNVKTEGVSFDSLQAYSVFFHETLHWWQHIGSTTGLFLSLSYPSQMHGNLGYLRKFLDDVGPVKSIMKFNEQNAKLSTQGLERFRNINIILNNFFDIHFSRNLMLNPKQARDIVNHKFFESVGHSYKIFWEQNLMLLSSTLDKDFSYFINPEDYHEEFKRLEVEKIDGFYHGSPVRLSSVGAREIFEGQARFSQLQFLHYGTNREFDIDDFEEIGLVDGIYLDAFNLFLKILGKDKPKSIGDRVISLFLLVCDLAINPFEFLWFSPIHIESVIWSNDPGFRFLTLCQAIRDDYPDIEYSIKDHSSSEYLEISEKLSHKIASHPPSMALDYIVKIIEEKPELMKLMDEDLTFKFEGENLSVRILFARYLSFQKDKAIYPEFFCWPGVNSAGSNMKQEYLTLTNAHIPLFCDRDDGDIYPSVISGRKEEDIQNMFNQFYAFNVTYDLTNQWIRKEGNFDTNMNWLTSKYSSEDTRQFADHYFRQAFETSINEFKIL